jgi:hypothetical protein
MTNAMGPNSFNREDASGSCQVPDSKGARISLNALAGNG